MYFDLVYHIILRIFINITVAKLECSNNKQHTFARNNSKIKCLMKLYNSNCNYQQCSENISAWRGVVVSW